MSPYILYILQSIYHIYRPSYHTSHICHMHPCIRHFLFSFHIPSHTPTCLRAHTRPQNPHAFRHNLSFVSRDTRAETFVQSVHTHTHTHTFPHFAHTARIPHTPFLHSSASHLPRVVASHRPYPTHPAPAHARGACGGFGGACVHAGGKQVARTCVSRGEQSRQCACTPDKRTHPDTCRPVCLPVSVQHGDHPIWTNVRGMHVCIRISEISWLHPFPGARVCPWVSLLFAFNFHYASIWILLREGVTEN